MYLFECEPNEDGRNDEVGQLDCVTVGLLLQLLPLLRVKLEEVVETIILVGCFLFEGDVFHYLMGVPEDQLDELIANPYADGRYLHLEVLHYLLDWSVLHKHIHKRQIFVFLLDNDFIALDFVGTQPYVVDLSLSNPHGLVTEQGEMHIFHIQVQYLSSFALKIV